MDARAGTTIIALLRRRAARSPQRVALYLQSADGYSGLTWQVVEREVLRCAAGLMELGIGIGDRVALLSENRFEWIIADLALQCIAAISVPLHVNLASDQLAAQIRHSGARLVLVSHDDPLERLRQIEDRLPDELCCFSFDSCEGRLGSRPVPELSSIQPAKLDPYREAELTEYASRHVSADTLATILYTSGTSGGPKGVMLTQGNLAFNALATYPATGEREDDRKLAFLPLSHIFARTCDLYAWIACGNELALAASRETVLDDCQAIRPTWINAVPYWYDKVRRLAGEGRQAGTRLRELLGGRMRSCQCGGAAVSRSTFDYFWHHEVPLFPGYGLTEASPVISVSSPGLVRWGCVGKPLPGIEVRLADDGEILTRGAHVMQGYWRDEAATADAIRDGWLHTGDLGAWGDGGLLQVRGRKKELIVTATGHKILPSRLETLLVQDPWIDQAFVSGDERGFPVALIVLNRDLTAERDGREHAGMAGSPFAADAIAPPPGLRERIDAALAGLAQHEQIRRFAVLPRPFSLEHGELTPKASLRRDEIIRNWSGLLKAMCRSRTERPGQQS